MKPQDNYYILIGRRYLLFPAEWLKKGGGDLNVGRVPSPLSAIDSDRKTYTILKKLLGSRKLDKKTKASILLQRVKVEEFEPQMIVDNPNLMGAL